MSGLGLGFGLEFELELFCNLGPVKLKMSLVPSDKLPESLISGD